MTQRKKSERPAIREALRIKGLEQRKPTEADRPPIRPFSGRKSKPIPGQLTLDGENEEQ